MLMWFSRLLLLVLISAVAVMNLGAVAYAEVVVAVGTQYLGSNEDVVQPHAVPLILHSDQGSWRQAELPLSAEGDLLGVTFSDRTTVWAYGTTGLGGLLYRSRNSGVSWEDATYLLPQELRQNSSSGLKLAAVRFSADGTGWLVAKALPGIGPYVATTSDGGLHWRWIDGLARILGSWSVPTHTGRIPEFLQVSGEGSQRVSLLNGMATAASIESDALFAAHSLATVGNTRWVVGSTRGVDGSRVDDRAILSARDESAWRNQDISSEGRGQLFSIHMRDESTGIGGGIRLHDNSLAPFLLYTRDGGLQWRPGTFDTALLDGYFITHVFRATGEAAWAVARRYESIGSFLLQSDDGGASWMRVPTLVDANSTLRFLAVAP